MSDRLEGKIAIVTGAGAGQGAAVARRYAEEGAVVLGLDLMISPQADGPPGVELVELDITELDGHEQISRWIDRRGGCDILYNNAGLYLPGRGDGDVTTVDPEVWRRVLDVNLTAAWRMIRTVVPAMERRGGGVVINVASIAGVVGGTNVAYTASKAGLIGLTKSLAVSHGKRGIRSIAISPGPVDTQMMDHWRDHRAALLESVPLRRMASADEMAEWAVFLASDAASFATGTNFIVDGGRITGI